MKKQYIKSVGKSVKRIDAEEKARGTSLYVNDIKFPGMLYGGVFRSPVASGIITKLDVSKAKKVKGIVTILTYKDIPGKNLVPVVFDDQPLLAEKEIRYVGEPICLIAAENREAIRSAISKINIEIKENKPVLSIKESLTRKRTVNPRYKDNVLQHYLIERGNVNKAFKKAHLVIENEYETNYQEHAYLETQGMVAIEEINGIMTLYGSMQCPFYVQEGVATILGRDYSKVSVKLMTTGGAFGGKEDVPSIIGEIAALLSYKTKKPVKFTLSREEDIETMSKRHPSFTKYRSAYDKDGKLLAVDIDYYLDGGAYSTLSPIVLWRGVIHAIGPYDCPNVRINGSALATNKVPSGAYRGFGTPQIIFAAETQMDIAAEKLELDPVKIREMNCFRKGSITSTGQILKKSIGILDTIKKGKKGFNYEARKRKIEHFNKAHKNIKRGIGVASLFYGVGLGARGGPLQKGSALVSLFKDGSVQFSVGTTEMGQGMYTVLSQITAENFGIPFEKVSPTRISTEKVSDSGPTVASRATFISGNAIKVAATRLKRNLIEFMLREKLIKSAKKIEFKNNNVYENGKKVISFPELAMKAWLGRVKMIEASWYLPPETSYEMEDGQGDAYVVYSYVTNFAEVEVDLRTYRTQVIDLISSEEFGKVINPQLASGQIEGGNAQGIGYALYENMVLDKGRILTNSFSTYTIPTILDVGNLKPVIVEKEFKEGPYGAKGMGEMPLMGIAPTIGNAIYNAIGIRLFKVPFTPVEIYEEIKNR